MKNQIAAVKEAKAISLNDFGLARHISLFDAGSVARAMGCSVKCLQRIESTPIDDLPVLVVVAHLWALGVAPGPRRQGAPVLEPRQAKLLAMQGLLIETAPGVFVASPSVRKLSEIVWRELRGRRIDVEAELRAHEGQTR